MLLQLNFEVFLEIVSAIKEDWLRSTKFFASHVVFIDGWKMDVSPGVKIMGTNVKGFYKFPDECRVFRDETLKQH